MDRLTRKVWISGNPPFSLNYTNGRNFVPSDIVSFRPDPKNYLKKGKKYWANLYFVEDVSPLGTNEKYLRKIVIKTSRGEYSFDKVR